MDEVKVSLSDRMKYYESLYNNTFEYVTAYLIRLDGNGFSKRIKKWKLKKPFDINFHWAMIDACKALIELIPDAKLIWTGSDEVTVLCIPPRKKDAWFANRLNKVVSLTASYYTAYFNKFMNDSCINVNEYPAFFDARVISVPSIDEALNNILSRCNDCKRNSISMYADSLYTHKELLNKNSEEKIKMLSEKNLNWQNSNKIPNWTKYGTIIYKTSVYYNKNTKKEIKKKNILELAKNNPDNYFVRTKIKSLDLTEDDSKNIFEKINTLIF